MKFLFYSSPYEYYADNLIPLAKYFKSQGHEIHAGKNEKEVMLKEAPFPQFKFSNDKKIIFNIKYDAIILTQPWWYWDADLAVAANKYKIPFYIVDHAPPMFRYTETRQKQQKSHLYRGDLRGAKNFFAYGPQTIQIMKEAGCKSLMTSVGSSRLEEVIKNLTDKKSGYVLFDTSHRMEDQELVSVFLKFVKRHSDQKFLIKEHSRSPQWYRKGLKFKNVELANRIPESELFQYSDFIFTFPSSAMLIPALLGKNIFVLYQNHYCEEAKTYYQSYSDIFPELGCIQKSNDYSKFLTNNILYREDQSTNERIYQHIIKDFK